MKIDVVKDVGVLRIKSGLGTVHLFLEDLESLNRDLSGYINELRVLNLGEDPDLINKMGVPFEVMMKGSLGDL